MAAIILQFAILLEPASRLLLIMMPEPAIILEPAKLKHCCAFAPLQCSAAMSPSCSLSIAWYNQHPTAQQTEVAPGLKQQPHTDLALACLPHIIDVCHQQQQQQVYASIQSAMRLHQGHGAPASALKLSLPGQSTSLRPILRIW